VQNERVGCSRPLRCRQRTAELLLDDHWIVGIGNAEAIGYPEHVAIHRKPGHIQRMPEHDVGGLTADAGQRRQLLEMGRHFAAVLSNQSLCHSD